MHVVFKKEDLFKKQAWQKRVEGRAQISNFKTIMEFLTKIKDFVNNENQNIHVDQNIDRNVNQFTENDQGDALQDDVVEGDVDMEGDVIEGDLDEEDKE